MAYDIAMTPEQIAAISDPHALRAAALQMASEKLASIAVHTTELAARDREIDFKQRRIDALTAEIARLKRVQFGAKTEALSALQKSLFGEAVDEDAAIAAQQLQDTQTPSERLRARPKREALPEHLPRVTTVHEPERCTCETCAAALVKLGEHISEKLAYMPARFHVERHVYPQYACRVCETVVAVPVLPAIIDRGMPAASLLAQIVIAKYCDHLPLYRQQAIYARAGVELARSTLAEWSGAVGVALQPLVDRLRERLHQQACLHADETTVATLDPGSGKTHQSYLFAYRSTAGPPIVVFDYATSRSGKHARQFLEGWRGALMVDDYVGYKALFGAGVTELACWVHVRRKFVEVAQASGSPLAHEAVARISALYRIEAAAREQGLAGEALRAHRVEHATPVLMELHEWLQALSLSSLKNSSLNKAVQHALGRWPALLRYLDDGGRPIDNNPIENAIRPIAVGRKNWLFIGATRAGERAAALISLIATAKANGLCPHAWLSHVLDRLPTARNSDIDLLLPLQGWTPAAAVGAAEIAPLG